MTSQNSVEDLVARCLEEIEAFAVDAVDEACREHPRDAERVRKGIAALRAAGLFGTAAPGAGSAPDEAAPDQSGDGPGPYEPLGPYQPLRELGRGGQAIVYLAEDRRLHRPIALKMLKGFGPLSATVMKRFRREAEVASKLDHPGICPIFDAGIEKGIPYIAMRYVPGETLAARIAAATPRQTTHVDVSGDTLPVVEPAKPARVATTTREEIAHVLAIVEKVARALHAAHEAGIVHRDVKPGNVMVTRQGEPVILDFGLAGDEEGDLGSLTQSGDVFGTPAYMSPEQLLAQKVRLDRRTDVYSLGVTLFECLTLRRPFEAPTREAMYRAIQYKDPPDVRTLNPNIPADLRVVLETALEKDRDRRYATAAAFAEDLRRVREHEPIAAKPVGPIGRLVRYAQRRPARAALIAVLVIAVPAIAALVTAYVKDRPQVEAARLMRLEQIKDELLSEASVFATENDHAKALDVYRRVSAMEGGSREAVAGLVFAHLRLRQPESALAVLDQNAGLMGGAAATLLRAEALRALGRTPEAEALEKGVPPPRDSFDFLVLAGLELDAAERGAEGAASRAVAQTMRAILHSPKPRLLHYAQRAVAARAARDREAGIQTSAALREGWRGVAGAHAYAAVARFWDPAAIDDVIAEYREAIRLRPDFAPWHSNLGSALGDQGKDEESIGHYREAVRLDPRRSYSHYNLANSLRITGRLDEAIAEYREAIRLDPAFAGAHFNLGITLNAKESWNEAIAAFDKAAKLDPSSFQPPYSRGLALEATGRLPEAIAAFREAVRLSPDRALLHCKLGEALRERGRFDEAIAEQRAALRLKLDPNEEHLIRECLAGALRAKGRLEEAIAEYRAAAPTGPHCGAHHSNLGQVLWEVGRLDEALVAFAEGARLSPDNARAIRDFGISLMQLGRLDEALDRLRETVRLDPGSALCHENLGRCLSALGRYGEAVDAFRRGREGKGLALAESRASREPDLARALAGGGEPQSASELLLFASMALAKGTPAMATKWYAAAFDADPLLAEIAGEQHRLDAARAAVRGSLWSRAREWLQEETARLRDPDLDPGLRGEARRRLLIAKHHVDLAPVRGPAIDRLPAEEQAAWRSMWEGVHRALAEEPR